MHQPGQNGSGWVFLQKEQSFFVLVLSWVYPKVRHLTVEKLDGYIEVAPPVTQPSILFPAHFRKRDLFTKSNLWNK